tara:strand:- start:256 stop:501 length:246 start_codon:yes stop_codon:yes gene_type:complete
MKIVKDEVSPEIRKRLSDMNRGDVFFDHIDNEYHMIVKCKQTVCIAASNDSVGCLYDFSDFSGEKLYLVIDDASLLTRHCE